MFAGYRSSRCLSFTSVVMGVAGSFLRTSETPCPSYSSHLSSVSNPKKEPARPRAGSFFFAHGGSSRGLVSLPMALSFFLSRDYAPFYLPSFCMQQDLFADSRRPSCRKRNTNGSGNTVVKRSGTGAVQKHPVA